VPPPPPQSEPAPQLRPESQERRAETAVTIIGLTEMTCRWPLWGDGDPPDPRTRLYCGAVPIPGHRYCGGHMRIAYRAGAIP
jgi:hypothetical protein